MTIVPPMPHRPKQDQAWLGPGRIAHPVGAIDSDVSQKGVQDTDLWIQDPQPEDGACHGRNDRGQEIDHAVDGLPAHFQIQKHGTEKGDQQGQWNTDVNHVERVGQGLPEQVIL